jgi:hypothetical protein
MYPRPQNLRFWIYLLAALILVTATPRGVALGHENSQTVRSNGSVGSTIPATAAATGTSPCSPKQTMAAVSDWGAGSRALSDSVCVYPQFHFGPTYQENVRSVG